jgi:hypothetical protein
MDLFSKASNYKNGEGVSAQSPDENKLVAHIREKVEECRNSGARMAWLGTTMTNIAYLLGFNGVYWDSGQRSYRALNNNNRYLNRNRLNANKILPRAQNRAARLCKNPPKYDVRPESPQTEDKDAARLGLQAINMIWDVQKINQKRIPMVMWCQEAGYAFAKTSWDPTLGRWLPELGEWEGDIRVDMVSPMEVFQDPTAKSLAECAWVVHAKVRKLDYFRTQYPEKGELIKAEDAWITDLQYESRINSLTKSGPATSGTDIQLKNSAIEMVYYERPSKNFPMGRQITCANGVLLEDKELPIGEIPFAKFDDVVIGGKFISEAVITHARPLQDQLTRVLTKRAEWTNRLLAGKYLAPRGHGISPEGFNDQSGEILEYNANPAAPRGGEPTPLPVPNIPQYAYLEEERLEANLNDIFGLNEISNGQIPTAGMPAAGMQILLEQDATRIGIITENHEHAWADVGRHILKYISKYYETPRLLKVAGSGLDYTVKSFQGSDLRNNHDVYVIRGSTVPNSKTLQRQEILNTYQMGLLGDPSDPKLREKVLSILEYGDVAEMWQDFSIDMAQINRDLDQIKKGEIPDVNELDNHPLHVQEKNRYRKSDKYGSLSEQSRAILEANIEEHLQEQVRLQNPGLNQQSQMAEMMADKAQTMTPDDALAHQDPSLPPVGSGPGGAPV